MSGVVLGKALDVWSSSGESSRCLTVSGACLMAGDPRRPDGLWGRGGLGRPGRPVGLGRPGATGNLGSIL